MCGGPARLGYVRSYHCKQNGSRQQGCIPQFTTPKQPCTELGFGYLLDSVLNRGSHASLSQAAHLPGKGPYCCPYFCRRKPEQEPWIYLWHSTPPSPAVSQVLIGFRQGFRFRKSMKMLLIIFKSREESPKNFSPK